MNECTKWLELGLTRFTSRLTGGHTSDPIGSASPVAAADGM
ncbi:hypothetical protein [Kibdelosporangium philippinense]